MSQTSKGNPMLGLISAGIAAYLLLHGGTLQLPVIPDLFPKPKPESVVVDARFPEPSPELKAQVTPIVNLLKNKPQVAGHTAAGDAAKIASIYGSLWVLLEQNPDKIATSADLRAKAIAASNWMTKEVLGPPGSAPAILSFIQSQIGNEAVVLDTATRTKGINAYKAVAWAAEQAAKEASKESTQ